MYLLSQTSPPLLGSRFSSQAHNPIACPHPFNLGQSASGPTI